MESTVCSSVVGYSCLGGMIGTRATAAVETCDLHTIIVIIAIMTIIYVGY